MKIYIYGNNQLSQDLEKRVHIVLEELGLTDFITLELTTDLDLKKELQISEDSALIIEEETIDFKDMIFEGILPEEEELKSMFLSIIGGGSSAGGCAPEGCGSGCSC